jgi:ribonuclease HII
MVHIPLKVRHTDDSLLEVGIDEAGRGCFWGPLYAGAVIWPPQEEMSQEQKEVAAQIRDSKKVSPKKRALLCSAIQDLAIAWGVGRVDPHEIDTHGMTRANQLAFERALGELSIEPDRLLIDGRLSIYEQPWSMKEQIVEPEADGRYLPVAAASILAKEFHDAWIVEYATTHPTIVERYDLLSCKGYGTKKHCDGILSHGPHSLHRKLFLRNLLSKEESQNDLITVGVAELEDHTTA